LAIEVALDEQAPLCHYIAVRYSAERNTKPGRLADLGRFSEPALLILVSLAGGPKHGYAIMDDVGRLARAKLGPGTLYAALARLESMALIEALPAEDRRRPYRLSGAGADLLRAELEDLRRIASTGLQRLAVPT